MTPPMTPEEYELAMAEEHAPRDDMEPTDVARAIVFVALCWSATALVGYGVWVWVTG